MSIENRRPTYGMSEGQRRGAYVRLLTASLARVEAKRPLEMNTLKQARIRAELTRISPSPERGERA